MAKKKKTRRPVARRQGTAQLARQLAEVETLIRRKQWREADAQLETLEKRHPRQSDVLVLHLEVATRLHDFRSHERICRQLIELLPDDPMLPALLAGSQLTNTRLALAVRTFRSVLQRWPNHPEAEEIRRILNELEPELWRKLTALGLGGPDDLELGALHEQVQVHLESGEFARARGVAEKLLQARPRFAPALNNLAESYFREGNYEQAVEAERRVLAFAPDNVHALANLTRYLFLAGRATESEETADRLRAVHPTEADGWLKVVETLSILGDDIGVLRAYQEAKKSGIPEKTPVAALLEHLAGVASYRQGNEADARRHWQSAIQHQPGYTEAQANLDDLQKPIGSRNAAWPFNLAHWIPRRLIEQLAMWATASNRGRKQASLKISLREVLKKHPEVEKLVPALLDRGDPSGRQFALHLALDARTPALLASLRDFALGQRGPDQQRHEAARTVSDARMLPTGPTRMWFQGKWHEILLLSFEITDEPVSRHSPEVDELHEKAAEELRAENGKEAEVWLRKCLEAEPDAPDLCNNLAMAFQLQGRDDEAMALLHDNHARHPDYLFAGVAVAKLAIRAGRLEEAGELLRPFLERRKFHISEFAAFVMGEIELQLARGEREGARSWLKMWEDIAPDHPALPAFRKQVSGRSILDWLPRIRG